MIKRRPLGLAAVCALLGACALVQPRAAAPSAKIAFLLPETKTARYETQDLPHFRAKLVELGFDAERNLIYLNANQNAAAQQQQAEAALTNGAKVLVLDPVDSDASAAIADKAKAMNVPVIAYDRLIKNTDAVAVYISFDNELVGRLQAEALLQALNDVPDPTIVMINGAPTDNNATQFKRGAHAVFAGRVRIAKEYDTPDWSPDKAQEQMTQALTALGNAVDGVYAANDGTAGGAIAAMKAAGIHPLPPVTGQDAELAGIQRIVAGEQLMTVYKNIQPQAELAAVIALALLKGEGLSPTLINGTTPNGRIDVPSVLLTPSSVTRDRVRSTVIADGFWTAADVCAGEFAEPCAAAGIR